MCRCVVDANMYVGRNNDKLVEETDEKEFSREEDESGITQTLMELHETEDAIIHATLDR